MLLRAPRALGSAALAFQRLPSFGNLSDWSSRDVQSLLDEVLHAGGLHERYTTREINGRKVTYKEVGLNDLSWEILRDRAPQFAMTFPARVSRRRTKSTRASSQSSRRPENAAQQERRRIAIAQQNADNSPLFEHLKQKRAEPLQRQSTPRSI